jgi:hypothetical protein
VRGEGGADFVLGEGFLAGTDECGTGGQNPGEGVREAAGGEMQIRQAAERGRDGGAESVEDCGESLEEVLRSSSSGRHLADGISGSETMRARFVSSGGGDQREVAVKSTGRR